MTSPILRVNDLIVRPEDPQLTFECAAGLTLLVCARESGASTLSMTLAGRFTPASGDIDISGARTTRERFRAVALGDRARSYPRASRVGTALVQARAQGHPDPPAG
ncbi:hypothetical protein [uncultured Corynebacterium sp.]|uniref:hypothetical protein n=1 Tax=uncultured Corynebacterium sp. TaxID=159447 RepID=UPI0025959C18|nr:hypothetical protein [uncultured Corynebacterium sp.]